jgi:hypothetical protein
MTIYVMLREDQNDHGFVDVTVEGVFHRKEDAQAQIDAEEAKARAAGMLVDGDDAVDEDWEVSWRIEGHTLR